MLITNSILHWKFLHSYTISQFLFTFLSFTEAFPTIQSFWWYHCVKSIQTRSSFWSVFSHIPLEYGNFLRKSLGKYGPGKTSYLDTFHTAYLYQNVDVKWFPPKCFAKTLAEGFIIGRLFCFPDNSWIFETSSMLIFIYFLSKLYLYTPWKHQKTMGINYLTGFSCEGEIKNFFGVIFTKSLYSVYI